MSAWTHTQPPVWKSDAVATPAGWAHPTTGELLVAIRGLQAKGVDATAVPTFTAALSAATYAVGDLFRVNVTASEEVKVTSAAKIVVTINGQARDAFYNHELSTTTAKAFTYQLVEADKATAGKVTVGTSIVGGQVKDVLPGGNVRLVPTDARTFAAINTAAVTVTAA